MTKEEKDKLIELSDLNREDNIKYISSEAQGIAITLDSDRYAPILCKLERAYICGRRKSEKRIEELENQNKLLGERCNQLLKDKGELTDKIADIKANFDLAIEGRDIKIKELELELTVEKDQHQEEINLHLHAEEYIKSLEKENAELKDLIKNIIRVTWGEGWNYSLDWKVKAEQFLNSKVEK